jgi:signal transduction histidine kinase
VESTDARGQERAPLLPLTVTAHTDDIVDGLEQRLRLLNSPLLQAADLRPQLVSQVESILAALTTSRPAHVAGREPGAATLSAEIGGARANAGIHPRESLRAAALLFEAALPVVLRELPASAGPGPGQPETAQPACTDFEAVALALHAEIMDRVSVAAVPYVSLLLQRMHTSQFDERRRIARDLHDGAAHAVGVAMQQLELYDVFLSRDPEAAPPRRWAAREALEEALGVIRGLSAELGGSPTEDGLDKALARYLDANVPPTVRAQLVSSADVDLIPSEVGDQLYFVIREAVRNALIHAKTAELRVTLNVTDNVVSASVEDFGRGLDIPAAMTASHRRGSGSGLTSMQERVELLGGVFALTSLPGRGTKAEIVVPLLTGRR